MELNQYCQECLKFTQSNCEGKDSAKITRWGRQLASPSGLKFCSRYELDGELCGGSNEQVETFKDIRNRQQKKTEQDSNQEIADDVNFGESLSSSDFEGLPE